MIFGQPQRVDMLGDNELGFSITSLAKKVGGTVAKTVTVPTKYAVKATVTSAKYAKKGAVVAGKGIYQAHAIPTKWLAIKPTEWLAHKALAPVKSRVQTIVNRRARKLAWDRRKSKTPTPAEHQEARTWTRNRLLASSVIIPAAPLLAAFAGAPVRDAELGVAPAVVAAAVPVMMAAAAALISQFNKSGEAPANPGDAASAQAPASAPDAGVPNPGEVDTTPVQDAADQAKEAIDQAADAAQGKKHGAMMKLPGGMKVSKSHLMIGGALVIGLVVVMSMSKKK